MNQAFCALKVAKYAFVYKIYDYGNQKRYKNNS